MTTTRTWNDRLVEQVDWHWAHALRPRLDGLTDEEYLWEPVPSWNVRPRGTGTAAVEAGVGDAVIEFAFPEPDPVPFTTIAWRLGHVIVGVLAMRNASHFDGPAADYEAGTTRRRPTRRSPSSTRRTPAGSRASADWATRASNDRAVRLRDRTAPRRWPTSSCTSAAS